MKRIKLTQGKFALVDDADFEWLNQRNWYAVRAKGGITFYARRTFCSQGKVCTMLMHRQIMSLKIGDGKEIDHRNHNGLDNRCSNLRLATPTQNQGNKRAKRNTTSKHKGVWWCEKGQKWRAAVSVNKKNIYLGSFNDEDDAGRTYDKKAITIFGEFANLNFKNER